MYAIKPRLLKARPSCRYKNSVTLMKIVHNHRIIVKKVPKTVIFLLNIAKISHSFSAGHTELRTSVPGSIISKEILLCSFSCLSYCAITLYPGNSVTIS